MRIRIIDFDPAGLPAEVTVTLTLGEAVYLAELTGNQTGIAADQTLPEHGAEANDGIYDCLTGSVFNVFWEHGVTGAKEEL